MSRNMNAIVRSICNRTNCQRAEWPLTSQLLLKGQHRLRRYVQRKREKKSLSIFFTTIFPSTQFSSQWSWILRRFGYKVCVACGASFERRSHEMVSSGTFLIWVNHVSALGAMHFRKVTLNIRVITRSPMVGKGNMWTVVLSESFGSKWNEIWSQCGESLGE